MNWMNIGQIRKWGRNILYPRSSKVRWTIVLGLFALYVVSSRFVLETLGNIGAALITIPVALTGWYFGKGSGFVSSLIGAILNALLSQIHIGGEWFTWLIYGWPGNLFLVITGYGSALFKEKSEEQAIIVSQLQLRERYLSLIGISTQDILIAADLETKYYSLTHHLVNMLVADYGHLILWDERQQTSILMATTQQKKEKITLNSRESSIISSILQEKQAVAIENAADSGLVLSSILSRENAPTPKSILYVPLAAKEYQLGVVLLAYNTPHRFTQDEISHANLAGQQVAIALQNAIQSIEIQKRLRESNALTEIGRALSKTERTSPHNVLQIIVDSARELIPDTEQAVIHLFDNEERVLIPQAVSGYQEQGGPGRVKMGIGEGVAGKVIAERTVVSIADVQTDPRFRQQNAPPKYRSLMVAPVQSGEECIGTISIQSSLPGVFSLDEEILLSALGAQAAIAIENARLLETTKQGYKEISALYHITQGLASTLETEQLMKDVVDLLQKSFGYYHVAIFVVDPETEDLIARHGSGTIGDIRKGERLPAGAGIIGHAAVTGEPFFTNDVNQVVFFSPHPLLPDTQSELAVPIKVNGRVLGVLDAQQRHPNRITARDQQLVGTVADQLAVALQKASLYSDLQASLAQEKSIRLQLVQSERLALVGRLLASVSHELNNPLQAIQNALFLLKDDTGISAQGRQDLQIVLSETERMSGLIERLRASYRPTQLDEFQPVQINTIVEDVYALLATHLRHKQVAFEFHPDPDLPLVSGLPDQLRQITLNLLMNGVEAITTGGRLTVSTETVEGKEVLLSVSDTGDGIDPVILPHIFDAFVTSKESGTGLGLTITYDIVHRHQGRIQAENNPKDGATFKVWLPILQAEQT
jgi:signal transduction histidine kinase/uncharacterized protein YigA (DUF484 family)